MNVEAQVVVGQLGGLFLQLPGEVDLPEAERQVLKNKKTKTKQKHIPFRKCANEFKCILCFYLFIIATLAHFSTFEHAE